MGQSTRSGIKIHEIHISRPQVPDAIRESFLELALTKQKHAIETEKNMIALEKTKHDNQVSELLGKQREQDKHLMRRIAQVQDLMDFERQKSRTDAESYKKLKQAEADRALFTPEYFKNLEYLHK